jgi:large subunit ribosomal protein L31e
MKEEDKGTKTEEQKTEEETEELAETAEELETEEIPEEMPKETVEEEEKPAAETEKTEEVEEEAPAEEEEKPSKREKEEEEEIVEERIYTIPLGKARIMPGNKRAARASRMIRRFIIKHMKIEAPGEGETEEEEEPKRVIISNEVNEKIWSKGIEKPPRNIRVRAAKNKEGNVTIYLAEGD